MVFPGWQIEWKSGESGKTEENRRNLRKLKKIKSTHRPKTIVPSTQTYKYFKPFITDLMVERWWLMVDLIN